MNPLAATPGECVRPGRVVVRLACLVVLLVSACARPMAQPAWAPTASPVPTSSTGCGLQSLPAAWQAATASTTLTPTRTIRLLAHDEATGRSLYAKDGSGVILTEPGSKPKVVLTVRSPMAVGAAAIDGDWMVLLTQNEVSGGTVLTALRIGGKPFQLFPGGGFGQPIMPWVVVRNGVLYAAVIANADEKLSTAVAVDLGSGRIVRFSDTEHVGFVLEWGDTVLLVDPESDLAGRVRAIDATTLAAVAVPSELAHLGHSNVTASDGTTAVWAALQEASVTVVRQGWPAPRHYHLPGDRVEQLSVWGRYVVEVSAERFWILDVETGQYAPVTTFFGDGKVSGGLLATSEMTSPTGGSAGLREFDLTSVPSLPACTG